MEAKRKSGKPTSVYSLEKGLNTELVELRLSSMRYSIDTKGYVINKENEVIGLCLPKCNIHGVSFLVNFPNLLYLNLYANPLRDISALLSLKYIKELDISGSLSEPSLDLSVISKLTELTLLDMSYMRRPDLSKIELPISLSFLDVKANDLTDISMITRCKNLKQLYLDQNTNEIDLSQISSLNKLEDLSLSSNKLSNIDGLSKLTNLKTLILSKNLISDISSLSSLSELKILDLDYNELRDISPLLSLNKLENIALTGNPISDIPVSDLGDIHAIRGYFKTLENDSKDALEENYHVKVNIVGSGNIGKTQLFNWFLDNPFQTERTVTHGTNVDIYQVKNGEDELTDYRASLWDFGGQSYQHGTHSLFLRPQDFYLVLFRNQEDSHNYGYWLGAARSFSQKGSEGDYTSPLFLIQSVWSEKGDELIYPESKKIETYQVSPDHCLSLDVKKCFEDSNDIWDLKKQFFQNVLYTKIIQHAKSFGQIPKQFNDIRKAVEDKEDLYLKKEQFVEEFAVDFSEERLAYLLQYLEFAGTIVYFREKELLSQYVFINPQRLSDWIYKTVLNDKFRREKKGVLDFKSLRIRLKKERSDIFRSLMLNFNLLFEEPHKEEGKKNQNLVIPQFLPENDHSLKRVLLDLIPFTFSIRFEDFIYEGRIFNFISEYGEYAEDNSSYWKYGILFKKDGVKSVVYYNIQERIIHVHIENKKESVKLSKEILDYFILKSEAREKGDEIRNEQGMKVKGIRIPQRNLEPENIIIGAQLSTNEENYIDIIETLKQKGESYKSGVCKLTHKSLQLDVLTLKLLEIDDKRLKKVFISYSRKDVKYKNELRSHLSVLNRYDLIKEWTCEEINMGKWHKQIQKELEEADIIVYMVSHNFLDSDYIMEKEVKKGIQLVENDPQKKILCVLVGSCQWNSLSALEEMHNPAEDEDEKYTRMSLDKYQFLPYHQYKSQDGVNVVKEELVPLENWGRNHYEVVNVAYNQIAQRILKEIR